MINPAPDRQFTKSQSDLESTISDQMKVQNFGTESYMPMAESIYPEMVMNKSDEKSLKEIHSQGNKLLESQNFEAAVEIYTQALPLIYQKSTPEQTQISEEILRQMAYCSLEMKKYHQCKEYSFEIIKINPQSPQAHYYIALSYEQQGQRNKCKKYINLAQQYNYQQSVEISAKWKEYFQDYRQLLGDSIISASIGIGLVHARHNSINPRSIFEACFYTYLTFKALKDERYILGTLASFGLSLWIRF